MTTRTNKFETGGNGTAITIANSDDAGDPIFDDVATTGTGAITYDTTNVFEGTYAAKMVMGASASLAYVQYNPASITTRVFARLYIYCTTNPSSNHRILSMASSGGTAHATIQLTTGGLLRIVQGGGSVAATCANAIPLNTWVRVDFMAAAGATGRIAMSFRTGDATHPTEVLNTVNASGQTSIGRVAGGLSGTAVSGVTFWMDKFTVGDDVPTDLGVFPIGIGTAQTGTTSVTPTFEFTTTAGNLIVLLVTSFTVQDPGAPSGYTAHPSNGNGDSAYIYYKPNCSAGETAPTLSAGSATFMSAVLLEFSGCATSSPVDHSAAGITNVGASPFLITVTGGVDTAVPQVAVFATSIRYSMSATKTTSNSSNNTTAQAVGNNDATSTATHYRFAWGITTSNAASLNDNFAFTTTNLTQLGEEIITFKQAAAAAAGAPVMPTRRRVAMMSIVGR